MALPYATEDQLKRVKKELEDKIGTGGGEIPEIPTKLSELTNDTGFITEAALADYALKTEIPEVGDLATKTEVGALIKTVGEGLQVGDSEHTTNINTTEDNKVMINSVGEVVYSTPYPGESTRKVVQFKNNDQLSGVTTGGAMQISRKNDEISITDDEKYYQSSEITISNTPPGNITGFTVSIESAPEGTILVDENGQKLESMDNVSKFYVRVPVDKVTEMSKTVRIKTTGTFRGYDGYYYRAEGAQTVSTVFTKDFTNDASLEFTLNYTPDVPSTGMSMAQSVYFIGLIVLLCGVGIIYANAKPKSKQQ